MYNSSKNAYKLVQQQKKKVRVPIDKIISQVFYEKVYFKYLLTIFIFKLQTCSYKNKTYFERQNTSVT